MIVTLAIRTKLRLVVLTLALASQAACTQVYSPLMVRPASTASAANERCNDLAPGTPVRPVVSTDPVPAPSGGTIAPGRYELIAFPVHAVRQGAMSWPLRAIALQVMGRTLQLVSVQEGSAPSTATFTFETQGSDLRLQRECGEWEPEVLGHSASADELRVQVRVPGGTGVWVLRRVVNQ